MNQVETEVSGVRLTLSLTVIFDSLLVSLNLNAFLMCFYCGKCAL